MRTITIHNKKLRELLMQKDELVKKGRKVSGNIETLEKEIAAHDEIEKKITASVNPTELLEKGEALQKKINEEITELEEIGRQIMKAKLDAIPKAVKDKHYALRKEKDVAERDRNKIALKVQKIKDRAIPIIQKETKPHLEQYDDIETATVVGEKIKVNIFNHLEEWKERFEKQSKQKTETVKQEPKQ